MRTYVKIITFLKPHTIYGNIIYIKKETYFE
jgi:hypothetical protein